MKRIISSEIEFNNITAPNRVVIQPMEGCDGTARGGIGELTRRRYMRFAKSGAGVIWFEAVAVCNEGRANPRQLAINDENVGEFKQLLDDIRRVSLDEFGYAPVIIMQATHSGRQSKPNGAAEPIIAYKTDFLNNSDVPCHIITDEECDEIIKMYGKAASLATQAGFDGIDVKCCHGYLFNEFLSAYKREGRYGGDFEGRTRLYFSCIDSVSKHITKNMFVTSRLNSCDCFDYPNGFGVNEKNEIDLSETKKILNVLYEKGVRLVNITIGNPYMIPYINRPFIGGEEDGMIGVNRILKVTDELQKAFPDMKLVLSALTFPGTDAVDFAERALENGSCSLVGFGRMSFAYPQFYVDYLKNGILDKSKVCIKCGNCSKMMRAGGVAGCPVRDTEVYLPLYKKYVEGK